jgi:hypothetical protein
MPRRPKRERRSTAVDPETLAARPRRGVARTLGAWLWRPVRICLLGVLVVVLFVEEWGWRPLTALAARVARWPPLAVLERRIRDAPRWVALALFLVPAVLLVPLKLAALWLIQEGSATLGIALILAAKLVGTAFVGRLFVLVEPQLMTFGWFARCVFWWRETRDRVMAALHRSLAWRMARAFRRVARRWIERLRGRV